MINLILLGKKTEKYTLTVAQKEPISAHDAIN